MEYAARERSHQTQVCNRQQLSISSACLASTWLLGWQRGALGSMIGRSPAVVIDATGRRHHDRRVLSLRRKR